MEFIDKNLNDYAENHSQEASDVLKELHRYTYAKVLTPRMLSGHLQGRFLSFISQFIQANNILEIGTYTGYSAICLAEGLEKDGQLHTIEINKELQEQALTYFEKAQLNNKIHMHIGHALDIIPNLDCTFDLVFIDADKENYAHYYEAVLPKLRKGGVIIADNVLWSGKVLDQNQLDKDIETKALDAFNKKVHQDNRVQNLLLPVRDGLMLLIKN
ncbi:MAG: methyltransferase [Bacteroidetes bacterium MED-G17]|jgi:predicted O-methyltransferase YrrM|nr:MAG: methyltransferase [Bacteroidetes bacterium MED-G17]CAI8319618.1 MAG: Putative O-methyltransferase/MSMEI_4947 [Bacteroidetes bacterium MED-G17]|tara:strand:+ start:4632 stop:5276 length:645 start_codon:yes stop_codon:yes gene_type:complete